MAKEMFKKKLIKHPPPIKQSTPAIPPALKAQGYSSIAGISSNQQEILIMTAYFELLIRLSKETNYLQAFGDNIREKKESIFSEFPLFPSDYFPGCIDEISQHLPNNIQDAVSTLYEKANTDTRYKEEVKSLFCTAYEGEFQPGDPTAIQNVARILRCNIWINNCTAKFTGLPRFDYALAILTPPGQATGYIISKDEVGEIIPKESNCEIPGPPDKPVCALPSNIDQKEEKKGPGSDSEAKAQLDYLASFCSALTNELAHHLKVFADIPSHADLNIKEISSSCTNSLSAYNELEAKRSIIEHNTNDIFGLGELMEAKKRAKDDIDTVCSEQFRASLDKLNHAKKEVDNPTPTFPRCEACGSIFQETRKYKCGHIICINCVAAEADRMQGLTDCAYLIRCPVPSCKVIYEEREIQEVLTSKNYVNRNPKASVCLSCGGTATDNVDIDGSSHFMCTLCLKGYAEHIMNGQLYQIVHNALEIVSLPCPLTSCSKKIDTGKLEACFTNNEKKMYKNITGFAPGLVEKKRLPGVCWKCKQSANLINKRLFSTCPDTCSFFVCVGCQKEVGTELGSSKKCPVCSNFVPGSLIMSLSKGGGFALKKGLPQTYAET